MTSRLYNRQPTRSRAFTKYSHLAGVPRAPLLAGRFQKELEQKGLMLGRQRLDREWTAQVCYLARKTWRWIYLCVGLGGLFVVVKGIVRADSFSFYILECEVMSSLTCVSAESTMSTFQLSLILLSRLH